MSDAHRKNPAFQELPRQHGMAAVKPAPPLISPEQFEGVRQLAPEVYRQEVTAILENDTGAAWQVQLLKDCVLAHRFEANIQIGELIAGYEPDSTAQLELYIRISSSETTYHRVKSAIRTDFATALAGASPRVFPMVLRKVGDVR
jgi:hypothetical protein